MPQSTFLKFSAPLIAVSLGLATLGAAAAWNVHRQQVLSSEIIEQEVHSLVATQNLYVAMREVRHHLVSYARSDDEQHLREIDMLHPRAAQLLEDARQLARTGEERAQLAAVEQGYSRFRADYVPSRRQPPAQRASALSRWVDGALHTEILTPAASCVRLNEYVVARTNAASRETSRRLTLGFLWLGLTGGTAGVMVGIAIMRSLRRSLWELHVSVSGATGKLAEVIGPSPESPGGGFHELRENLRELERRIIQVVTQLQRREREVLRNEQLAALGKLAAGLAHELRNPLMPMKMLVQAAFEHGDDALLRGRQLVVIRDEIARMEGAIQSFLDFARPPELLKLQGDFRPIARDTVELVQSRARHQGVDLSLRLPAAPCLLEFDTSQMRQVVLNLLLNALDSVGPQGTVDLTLEADALAPQDNDAWPNRDGEERQRGVLLSVSDNGPGIPEGESARIFEPFVSTKDSGTGLGLTICRRIVESHGGRIVGENLLTGGARFRAWLPKTPQTGKAELI